MRNDRCRYRGLLVGGLAATLVLSATTASAIPLLSQTTFGGAGDESGTGVAANSSGVYFSGSESVGQGVVGQFSSNLGPSPVWSRFWPGSPDGALFNGVALTSSGVIATGRSYYHTIDTVGGKEGKGVTAKFNADGSAGGGTGGAVWSQQTPIAPGGFRYGGHEWLTSLTTVSESGQTMIYTAGLGQVAFSHDLGRFVTKLDDSGNILWSRSDTTTITSPPAGTLSESWFTRTTGIAATGDSLYVASRSETGGLHPDLKKYDSNGNLLWTRTSAAAGEYRGATSAGGNVYAVGQTDPGAANSDFLIEGWGGAGNLLWSKTYDRSSTEDVLNAVVFQGGRLFAVGSTKGGTAGGLDGLLLELDSLTGNLLESTLWGGSEDDVFNGLSVAGSTLYAVGSTRSFGAGGSDIAIASFALNGTAVPEPETLLLVWLAVGGLALARRRVACAGCKTPARVASA